MTSIDNPLPKRPTNPAHRIKLTRDPGTANCWVHKPSGAVIWRPSNWSDAWKVSIPGHASEKSPETVYTREDGRRFIDENWAPAAQRYRVVFSVNRPDMLQQLTELGTVAVEVDVPTKKLEGLLSIEREIHREVAKHAFRAARPQIEEVVIKEVRGSDRHLGLAATLAPPSDRLAWFFRLWGTSTGIDNRLAEVLPTITRINSWED